MGSIRTVFKIALWLVPAVSLAHPGGTDDLGCHNDRQEGGYHCHSGPLDGRSFASEAEARRALNDGGGGSLSITRPQSSGGAYDRELYGDWRDADGDCQDTRTEVLIQEADGPIQWESSRRCEIESGTWKGPYTGETFHDPSELHIDHLVPLKEARLSGAADWPHQRKREFATSLEDPRVLIAVEGGANMSKGADGPADWMPPNEDYHCRYLRQWKGVKAEWGLEVGDREERVLRMGLRKCR